MNVGSFSDAWMNALEKSIVRVCQLSINDQARNSQTELNDTTGA